jgi:hypothetical protein
MLATIYYLTNGKLFKYGFNKIEISLLLLAISLSISILFGYIFLGVYPAIIDFYQVFNLFLFVLYFKIGRLSDIANFDKIVKVVSIIFLTYSIFNIITMFGWGFEVLLPYYIPEEPYLRNKASYDWIGFMPRSVGIMGNANSSAIISNIVFIISLSWLSIYRVKKQFSIYILIIIFIIIISTMSHFSRTGLLSLLGGLVALFWNKKIVFNILKLIKILAPIILIIAIFGSIALSKMDINPSDLRGFNFLDSVDISSGNSTLSWRFISWKDGLGEFIKSPIFGWGLRYHPKNFHLSPHNEFIDILMVTGLLGFILYLTFYYHSITFAIKVKNDKSSRVNQFLGKSLLAIIVSLLVHNIAVGSFFNFTILPIFLVFMGFVNFQYYGENNIRARGSLQSTVR